MTDFRSPHLTPGAKQEAGPGRGKSRGCRAALGLWESEEGDKNWEKQLSKEAGSCVKAPAEVRGRAFNASSRGAVPFLLHSSVGLMGEGHQQVCGEEIVR